MLQKTKYRRKYVTLTCNCGRTFERQLRRVILGKLLCNTCKKATIHKIKFWPTDKLKEVIDLEGQTCTGSDYEQFLDEIKSVLWERQNKEMEKYLSEMTSQDVPF